MGAIAEDLGAKENARAIAEEVAAPETNLSAITIERQGGIVEKNRGSILMTDSGTTQLTGQMILLKYWKCIRCANDTKDPEDVLKVTVNTGVVDILEVDLGDILESNLVATPEEDTQVIHKKELRLILEKSLMNTQKN